MGRGAGAGNILARFRALFCKLRGDTGGNGGQNWMEDRSEQDMPNVGNYRRRAWGQGSVMVVGWSGEGADWLLQVSLPLFGGHQWAGQEMRRRVTAEQKGPPNRKAESAPGFMAPVWAQGGGPKAAGAPGAVRGKRM